MIEPLPTIRDKHDLESARALIEIGFSGNSERLPHMLEWMQDMNWPVAPVIAEYLKASRAPIEDLVLEILRGDDGVWKASCIARLLADLENVDLVPYRAELRRIVDRPTADDQREGLPSLVAEILGDRGV